MYVRSRHLEVDVVKPNSQPKNADIAEDTSVPTLPNRFRLLVVPQKLQSSRTNKTYCTRGSGRSLGKLKGFMDLPMDVAFETAMYLAPKDLLQLSRLSKQFRSMFASRSALFVWKTAFRNVNLKCFKDLNEIQFTSLLYDKFCMACERIMKRCPTFRVLRLRLCPCCHTTNLVSKDDLQNQYPNAGGLIACLPASWVWCFKPEAHLLIEKFLSLEKETSRNSFIANMAQHSRARHEVITSMTGTSMTITSKVCGARTKSTGLLGNIQVHVEVVEIQNTML